ncbi:putative calcineurin-like phosphoesterase [Hamiltosporidium tvaerminnensis]|uniref:Putative calcineurin-like phosphoesterase n=1 Tax=Hamiltosporidium tvaerminnensis TaxID=1176355 RepID=A0A4Q9L024_9MICR|nr:putative calcineurin-like phosphoesterase [Hamiltosporidium tvaerminnensis]
MIKSKWFYYVSMISLSILVFTYILNITHTYTFVKHNNEILTKKKSDLFIERNSNAFFYFVQVTDLHINTHVKTKGFCHFKECVEEINSINPEFVIISGDIVDSMNEKYDGIVSKQDFCQYLDLVSGINVPVYDIRGNHDVFGLNSDENMEYLNKFMIRKERNYFFEFEKSDNKFIFVFIDGTPKFTSKRFLNFFGYFDDKEFEEEVTNKIRNNNYDHVILTTHYPSNTITTTSQSFFNPSVYLCGHLHNLIFFNEMYKIHENGCTEAELSDLKNNKTYRILTFDNGVFNFSDVKVGKEPKIAILTPKDKKLKTKIEPNLTSKYLRFLVFNHQEVKAFFNDEKLELEKENNLFTAILPSNIGKIKIIASNSYGNSFKEIDIDSSNHSTYSSFPLNINFLIISIFFLFSYFFVLVFLTLKKKNLECIIRCLFYFLLPCALGKFTKNTWSILYNFYVYPNHYFFDTVFYFTTILFLQEIPYMLYLLGYFSVLPYLIVCIFHSKIMLYFHFGIVFSIFDLFSLPVFYKYFKSKIFKKSVITTNVT